MDEDDHKRHEAADGIQQHESHYLAVGNGSTEVKSTWFQDCLRESWKSINVPKELEILIPMTSVGEDSSETATISLTHIQFSGSSERAPWDLQRPQAEVVEENPQISPNTTYRDVIVADARTTKPPLTSSTTTTEPRLVKTFFIWAQDPAAAKMSNNTDLPQPQINGMTGGKITSCPPRKPNGRKKIEYVHIIANSGINFLCSNMLRKKGTRDKRLSLHSWNLKLGEELISSQLVQKK
ncbi:hypothetical protein BTVI_148892 [Pitangus sulphuratus]|nr:hypothetical protein BTVI_148892 [Pitangus sulphuratus]